MTPHLHIMCAGADTHPPRSSPTGFLAGQEICPTGFGPVDIPIPADGVWLSRGGSTQGWPQPSQPRDKHIFIRAHVLLFPMRSFGRG